MKPADRKPGLRCAIYTRVSTEQGLEQEFNSLDNQREASEAYIKSQAHEGWRLIRDRYDDGGFSGGSMDRPALKKLLDDVRARRIDVIVVYKVDRLTRSLADFAKLVDGRVARHCYLTGRLLPVRLDVGGNKTLFSLQLVIKHDGQRAVRMLQGRVQSPGLAWKIRPYDPDLVAES